MRPLDDRDTEEVRKRASLLADRCGCQNPDVHAGLARVQIEIAAGPAATPAHHTPRLNMSISTRPQDWAPVAREILRQRGAWRDRR